MTARDRIVIVIVLVAAAIVGSWLMAIQPKRDRAAKLGDEVTAVQSQLDAARAKLAQARLAQNAYQAESAQLARLGQAVPPDDQVPSLIYQLQSAANGARIDFRGLQTTASSSASASPSAATTSTSLSAGAGSNGFPTEQFTFTFTGTYIQLSKFINHVQHFVTVNGNTVSVSGRLLALQSISLAASSSGFPKITATISASTYLMASSQSPTGGSTPTSPSTTSSSSPTASTKSSSSSAASAAVATPIR
jgi:type II secretory pathway pseudopilin PulG